MALVNKETDVFKLSIQKQDVPPSILEESYAICQSIIKKHSKSFSFASRFMNEEYKRGTAAIYAYCRRVDDIVDESDLPDHKILTKLREVEDMVNSLGSGRIYKDPIFIALDDVISKHHIPKKYMLELIEGVRMDLTKQTYDTIDELKRYSYYVASTVGLMMTHLWVDNPSEETLERAKDLGIAMQITNILRDVKEDYENGRIYLPREMLESYMIDLPQLLKEGTPSKDFIDMVDELIAIADEYYASGERGIALLPPFAQDTVKLASRVYGEITKVIKEQDYPILRKRVSTTKTRKMFIAGQVLLQSKVRNIFN